MIVAADRWFEVWFSEGDNGMPSWLLLVTPDSKNPGQVMVIDPQENYKVVYQDHNYEDTRLWLLEDEFSRVEGRMIVDE